MSEVQQKMDGEEALLPAAGPWIRVDSGEEPKLYEVVLVKLERYGVYFGYVVKKGEWRASIDRSLILPTHWASIFLPTDS